MADKTIGELERVSSIQGASSELFVVEQSGTAKSVTGQQFSTWLNSMASGKGYISSIAKTGSSGTNPVIDTYTITMTKPTSEGGGTETITFNVTNGVKGDTGETGATGATGAAATVSSQALAYAKSTTATQPNDDEFLSSVTPEKGKYYWTRLSITWNDGTVVKTYSCAYIGTDGSGAVDSVNGMTGDVTITGQDVSDEASVTIAVANWSSKTATKSVTGITEDSTLIVSPAPGSFLAYGNAQIRATAQGTNSITFTCEEVPSEAIEVNILIMN